MNLTPGITIERGDTVTRQTIYDVVAKAVGGSVQASDLTTEVLPVVVDSGISAANAQAFPGRIWWDQEEQLAKVYTDMIEGTGCSLWLAFGPDRFDVAVLATEDIPFGACVQLTGSGRKVKLPPLTSELLAQGTNAQWEHARIIGFNNNKVAGITAATAASGTWFACAVSGYVWCWYPATSVIDGFPSLGGIQNFDSLPLRTDLTGPSGISNIRGGIMHGPNALPSGDGRTPYLVHSHTRLLVNFTNWQRRLFFGPRLTRS